MRTVWTIAALLAVIGLGCTSGDRVDAGLVELARERLSTVTDRYDDGVGNFDDVDHCPMLVDQVGTMAVGDRSLTCVLDDDGVAQILFASLEAEGVGAYSGFETEMTSEGRWAVERVDVESPDNEPQIDSHCRVRESASDAIGGRERIVDRFCVAEFVHGGLGIVYLEINPPQTDSAAVTLSEQLTPILQGLANLDPAI